ncbi:MAG: hypothetical protein MK193_00520 [Lentisphaeria bacterium]|nr:hypothetical protein [Lentisphaeria bacterium]
MDLEVIGVICLIVLVIIISKRLDKKRIRRELESRGCTVDKISYSFGFYNDEDESHYVAIYKTPDGVQHMALCKTSLYTGVYWHSDAVFPNSSKRSGISTSNICESCKSELSRPSNFCPHCGDKL